MSSIQLDIMPSQLSTPSQQYGLDVSSIDWKVARCIDLLAKKLVASKQQTSGNCNIILPTELSLFGVKFRESIAIPSITGLIQGNRTFTS